MHRRRFLSLLALGLALPGWTAPSAPCDRPGGACAFAAEIEAFLAADAVDPPEAGRIVFTGSSSIRTWATLAADMAPLPVLGRGFGGAHLAHVAAWVDRIVIPYRPRAVVVYAGDNDIHHGKSPEEVAADFGSLVARVREGLEAPIVFLSIKPSPARAASWPAMAEANARVRAAVAADPTLRYVDVATPMLGGDGAPRPELFTADRLHLNAAGFALWTAILKPALVAEFS